MKTKRNTRSLLFLAACLGTGLAFVPVICAPGLLTAALAATALVGLVIFTRMRNARRWLAAVDAYADREIAQSRHA